VKYTTLLSHPHQGPVDEKISQTMRCVVLDGVFVRLVFARAVLLELRVTAAIAEGAG
jgi:hypothetical protein